VTTGLATFAFTKGGRFLKANQARSRIPQGRLAVREKSKAMNGVWNPEKHFSQPAASRQRH
jgi:hypothetical protein